MNRLSFEYFFSPLPTSDFEYSKAVLAIGVLLILLGMLASYYRKKKMKDEIARKILKSYPGKLRIYGLLVLMLLAFREFQLPYLSMNVWWYLLLAFFLYSFGKLATSYRSDYEKRNKRISQNKVNAKYLPKHK